MNETPLWNVAVRVVANVPAPDGWAAVRKLSRALEAAGFATMDDLSWLEVADAEVRVGAFRSEEGTTETELPLSPLSPVIRNDALYEVLMDHDTVREQTAPDA